MDDSRRCTAKNRAGERCKRAAVLGGTVCAAHGGKAPQVKAAAQRRLAEAKAAASLAQVGVTPIGDPLAEFAALAAEARALQGELAAQVAEMGRITGENHLGDRVLTPEFTAYNAAMDRCGRFLADWVRLGIDERITALHERQAELVARVLRAVIADPELGLTETQRDAAPAVARRHLELVAA